MKLSVLHKSVSNISLLNKSVLSLLTGSIFAVSQSQAAGLEYSKQSVLPLFADGNYAELSYAYVDPKIEGKDSAGNHINDMMHDFDIKGAAVKVQANEDVAFALIYDEPFGVDTIYPKGSQFSNDMGVTEARVDTRSLTFLGKGQVAKNTYVYGGLEYQQADGLVTLAQVDTNSKLPIYYDLELADSSETVIPIVGMAFEKPDIMLRAALTWRGQGSHSFDATENLVADAGIAKIPVIDNAKSTLSFNTPQSVNLDLQTGLSEKHQLLGMLNARWVEWTAFEVAPEEVTKEVGEPLAEYPKDAYSVEVGLGKQITPKLAGEVRVGYDSGTAEPLSLLGPYDSVKTLGVGANYALSDSLDISAGTQYMWFEGGDAYATKPAETSQEERTLAKFDDGTGYAVGVKVGYHF